QSREAKSREIIPGRAIVVSFDWHRNNRLAILAVYAPNVAKENKEFWKKIRDVLETKSHIPRPKIVLGDCNATEAHIDRFPPHLNDADMSVELLELQAFLGVQDGWRKTNPGKTGFTWRNADQTRHSRIDRIFVNRELAAGCHNWKIWNESLCPGTDHSAVTVEIIDLDMPFVGEGRPTMRPAYAEMERFMEDVVKCGIELEDELERLSFSERRAEENIQTKWPIFKSENMERAKAASREVGRKEMRLLAAIAKEKESLLQ
ncbi:DNase I-like protein, partial [Auricularia subglabra TFB-10046 SS5]